MAIFRSYNDIVLSYLETLRLVQPNLDTKPKTVARDLFVDAQAEQLANLYNELRNISSLQSLLSASGTDLAKLGSNFGVERKSGTNSTGTAVFTTNNLDIDILIPENTVVTSSTGITFKTTITAIMRSANSNVYRANATRLRSDLDLASITDTFAIEIPVESLTTGTNGNIGRFSLNSQNVPGISNITNLQSFTGGTAAESNAAFRTRILSVFAGSNTGTALGYESAINALDNVSDVITVVPGDVLMTRDGTQTTTDSNGNLVITSQGTGGKVDIYVLGSTLSNNIDSFIFNDQSGTGTISSTNNDYILGQQGTDSSVNVAQRRVELIAANNLPLQPIANIVSVVGSSSGQNFVEKFTDSLGNVKGNYELIKDEGSFGGSPFGFDKLRWVSGEIELSDESAAKGVFNGSDALEFTDVNKIEDITQDIFVVNENSTVSNTNRSSVKLLHTPIRTVSRVANVTTGERYTVTDQNPDGTEELNTTGNITISGGTLPVTTDILQVDYVWVKPYDGLLDFDNLDIVNRARSVQDSVDWSLGNLVSLEEHTLDAYGQITVEHEVSRVVSIESFTSETVAVSGGSIVLSTAVNNLIDIKRVSDGLEMFNTDARDGSLSGSNVVSLPSDTLAVDGDQVTVRFNTTDVFLGVDGADDGNFEGKVITMPEELDAYGTDVLATYVADIRTLLTETNLTDLPVLSSGNTFLIDGVATGDQPTSNIIVNNTVQQNLRKAPSHIRFTAASIGSAGVIGVTGTSFKKLSDVLVTVTSGNGYDIDLLTPILNDLGVSSLPSTVKVAKLASVVGVTVNNAGVVQSVDNTYDVVNYTIADNTFDLDTAAVNASLSSSTVSLPRTTGNTSNLLNTGDILRVTFYYVVEDDTEQLFFSRNGDLITDKLFSNISRISVISGFLDPAGDLTGTITVANLNQPLANSAYEVDYNYVAPKENERITITFNNNSVPRDGTLAIEEVRPITADVIVKEAQSKSIDVSIRIVLLSEFTEQEETVLQNAADNVTAFLTANSLGTTVDASDVVNSLYSVEGIDRVTVLNFSTGDSGNVLSITAQKNEFLNAGTVDVQAEGR